MNEAAALTMAGIGVAAIVCQWIAWWLKLPAILFLLLAGIAAGPLLGILDPNALLGDLHLSRSVTLGGGDPLRGRSWP